MRLLVLPLFGVNTTEASETDADRLSQTFHTHCGWQLGTNSCWRREVVEAPQTGEKARAEGEAAAPPRGLSPEPLHLVAELGLKLAKVNSISPSVWGPAEAMAGKPSAPPCGNGLLGRVRMWST